MIARAEACNRHPERCRYRLNERADLSVFDNQSFGFISSHIVLQHIPDDLSRTYIRDFVRLLQPAGICVFQTPQIETPRLSLEGDAWGFDMYGIPQYEVLDLIASSGGRILEVVVDHACGPDFRRYRDLVTREAKGS